MTRRRQGCSAPSDSDRVGSGTTSSGSTTRWKPSPWQRSQAPWGELKEKIARLELRDRGAAVEAGEPLAEGEPVGHSLRQLAGALRTLDPADVLG